MRLTFSGEPETAQKFQSTHSLRSATESALTIYRETGVSIHALLAECDRRGNLVPRPIRRFNPRTPCGVRPRTCPPKKLTPLFQSTHSLRSATHPVAAVFGISPVSIHALLAECDQTEARTRTMLKVSIHALLAECDMTPPHRETGKTRCFNPRTPCGVRPLYCGPLGTEDPVSIHALLAECDLLLSFRLPKLPVSIHALLAECDAADEKRRELKKCFNPRTPCGVRLRPTLYIATQQSKSYFAPTSLKRPSLHGCSF